MAYTLAMNTHALEVLEKERVCVLAVPMADGAPHAAATHFSYEAEPTTLFIQTYPTVKTKAIQDRGGSAPAAVVVGFDETQFVSLQMRGEVRIVSDAGEVERITAIHLAKHPEAKEHLSPSTIFLAFTPTWWRYTDFKTHPETVITE